MLRGISATLTSRPFSRTGRTGGFRPNSLDRNANLGETRDQRYADRAGQAVPFQILIWGPDGIWVAADAAGPVSVALIPRFP